MEAEVNRVVTDFFKDENTARRLILFRDKICKSSTSIIKKTDDKDKIKKCCCSGCSCDKVKGEVPLYQFYINMSEDDKRLNLVYKVHRKKDMLNLKEKDKELFKFKEHQQQLHKEAEILEKHGKIYLEEYKEKMAENERIVQANKEQMEELKRQNPNRQNQQEDDQFRADMMFRDEYMCRIFELKLEKIAWEVREHRAKQQRDEQIKQKRELLKEVFGADFKEVDPEQFKKTQQQNKAKPMSVSKAAKSTKRSKSKTQKLQVGSEPAGIENLIKEHSDLSRTKTQVQASQKSVHVKEGDLVFGEITLNKATVKGRAEPKDKWKLGNQLKEL